jgi:hypothetical protein
LVLGPRLVDHSPRHTGDALQEVLVAELAAEVGLLRTARALPSQIVERLAERRVGPERRQAAIGISLFAMIAAADLPQLLPDRSTATTSAARLAPRGHRRPTLMPIAKGQERDVFLGLNLGADDSITNP